MKKSLITGGAGYKGALLTEALLNQGHHVTILDNLMYGDSTALAFANNPNFNVNNMDVRNIKKSDVEGFDYIFHLAGISGFPACEANPHSAHTINVDATAKLVSLLEKEQVVVYASTTSMYGRTGNEQNEDSTPDPISLYGITKYEAEKICLTHPNGIALRFATIFGVGPRMRYDLMLNDFVHKAVAERALVLFDQDSKRTFLHVRDAIRAYVMTTVKTEQMAGQVFNVGDNDLNFSKLDLANRIKKFVEFEIVTTNLADPDRRDFVINYDKIEKLDFKAQIDLDTGIEELVRLYKWYKPNQFFNII